MPETGMEALCALWKSYPPFAQLLEGIRQRKSAQISGLSGSSAALTAAGLIAGLRQPGLVLTTGVREAMAMAAELSGYLPDASVFWIPPRPRISGEVEAASRDWEFLRIRALASAAVDPGTVLVAPVEAARQGMLPWPANTRNGLTAPMTVAPETVAQKLVRQGYRREAEATLPGLFAWRGGIVDIYPADSPPVRLEWFGDELESIREFDPQTQRTTRELAAVEIQPARELLWQDAQRDRAVTRIARESEQLVKNLEAMGQRQDAERARERYGRHLNDLIEGRSFAGVDRFVAAFGPPVPLTRMFVQPPVVICHDPVRVAEVFKGMDREDESERERRILHGDWLPVEAEGTWFDDQWRQWFLGPGSVSLSLMPPSGRDGALRMELTGRPAPRVHGQPDLLVGEMRHLTKARLATALLVRDSEAAEALKKQLTAEGLPVRGGLGVRGEIGILTGRVGQGFVLPELSLAVLGDTELTGREARPAKARRSSASKAVRLSDLKPGDFMVHVTHGVGRFQGVRTLEIQGQHRDYLELEYAGNDSLYVPVDQLNLVQKYVGIEGKAPKLSRMGGGEWSRVKEKVKNSVREMAAELIRLYAVRESRPGFGFGPDTPWQREFEAAFPYEETEDQLRAAEEIKRDMERPRPMDRLLCGDVGYGKTEVALRAAFKAIMDGKQAAFLVPTTLLAEQHHATAKARLAGFPITTEVLSRFRSASRQKEILQQLAAGTIDLVVGTHRLLAKDVRFKDLGLLIVDEEHRFGVAHKERMKALKESVDVLTLSATPIPRTLHMAMVGIRDMSLIETPPEDRLPVETVVVEFHPELIREAIRREIDREGQVFYVQNRIKAIDQSVSRLLKMFPELKVAVVHGQMEERRIEETMARFIDGEYHLLVATNIIESGLDIPNANTLIVEDADRMGLAQLYQLRGRVGRSSRLAYAYFTYQRDKMLTIQSEKRLEAIREFTALGSGYQIALRDLEIRGAGNLLGSEQHGFIASIGFDLYTDMLAEAVRELRGQPDLPTAEPQIEIEADAYLPDRYVADPRLKIDLYKRLLACRSIEAVEELAAEMEDRFGPHPDPVVKLVKLATIRVLAKMLQLSAVGFRSDRVTLSALPDATFAPDALNSLAKRFPGRLIPGRPGVPQLGVRVSGKSPMGQVLDTIIEVLHTLKGEMKAATQKSG